MKVWAVLAGSCDDLGGVIWRWQSADGSMGKARSGGDLTGSNPTDRGKAGTKRSLLVDGDGGPLGIVVAGANVNDHKLLRATIESVVVERPDCEQHLCLDKGYDHCKLAKPQRTGRDRSPGQRLRPAYPQDW